jgi:5-methyltetrahydrofolate corrinoid/iron sulfur protein methyltransferase
MFIIGELINGMYRQIAAALKARDAAAIQKCARQQLAAGAQALDINCGPGSADPVRDMVWLVETVQSVSASMIVLDASKPAVIEAGLKAARVPTMINSTTADREKLELLVGLAGRYNAKLIGLAMDARGIPQNKDQRLELAASIVSFCAEKEFPLEDLYLDPVLLPVKVGQAHLEAILESIREFRIISRPSPKTVVGLSNVSQGIPGVRSLINRTFLSMAAAAGLDAAILDPLDRDLMDTLITAEVILNKEIYCDSFLTARRKK